MTEELRAVLHGKFDEVVTHVTDVLKTEGFGVLTQVDVQSTLKEKLGATLRPYKILGACNPPFAHRAIEVDPEAGLMMPCNVVVYERQDGAIAVAAVDPAQNVAAVGQPQLEQLAAEVRDKLVRVVAKLKA